MYTEKYQHNKKWPYLQWQKQKVPVVCFLLETLWWLTPERTKEGNNQKGTKDMFKKKKFFASSYKRRVQLKTLHFAVPFSSFHTL